MKTLLQKYALSALVLSFGTFAFADKTIDTNLTEDTKWADLPWADSTLPTTADTVYLKIKNTPYNISINGGTNVSIKRLYLQNYTTLVVGDTSGNAASLTMVGSENNEFQHYGSLIIKSNGTVNLAGSSKFQFYDYQATATDHYAMLVDGGTFNGNFNVGTSVGSGVSRVKFQNGAVLNRNTELNPLSMSGRSEITFNNSTYNVWNAGNTQNNGFGNHVFNIGTNNSNTSLKTEMDLIITNGSVINGAGIVSGGAVTYYNFVDPITTSGMSAVPLTLQIKGLANDDDYFNFSILDGSKVSSGGIKFGSSDGDRTLNKGTLSFKMEGLDQDNMSMFAGFGDTAINLALSTESTAVWNFSISGNSSYQSSGNFNVSDANILGGKLNFDISGNNNVFTSKTLNVNGGSNNKDGSSSNADIKMYFGADGDSATATNSFFTFSEGINIYSGANSNIDVKFGGLTNTLSIGKGIQMTNSTLLGGNSTSRLEIADAMTVNLTENITLNNRASGLSELIISNGSTVNVGSTSSTKGISFSGSTVANGTAESYIIIDGGHLTTTGDNSWGVKGTSSGTMGIKMTGDNGSFTSLGQMNISNTDATTTDGKFIVDISGNNNTFEAKKNMHMKGIVASNDAGYIFSMTGSGNKAYFEGEFNLGNDSNTKAGTYHFISASTSATNKNEVLLGKTTDSGAAVLTIHANTTVNNATTDVQFVLGGNTILRSANGQGIHLKLLEHGGMTYTSGNALFKISGSGNDALFSNLQVGNNLSTGGQATFLVEGGGSEIRSTGNFQIKKGASNDRSWDNPNGSAVLEYRINDTGISAITVDSSSLELTGLLHLDFSFITSVDVVNERYVLISAKDSGLQNKLSNWITNFESDTYSALVKISGRDESDIYDFAIEENGDYYDFVVYYTSTIPEPATCAAIFGAVALAFAAYRRRK